MSRLLAGPRARAHTTAPDLGISALRVGPWSVPFSLRRFLVGLVLVLLCALAFTLGIGMGDYRLSVPQVLRTLAGGGSHIEETVVFKWRMGRAVLGLLVGAALAFAGALTQSVARNPLASPDVLGITSGASTAAVFVITASGGTGIVGAVAGFGDNVLGVPVVAVIGATLTALAVWFVAGKDRDSMIRLVLIGVGTSMFLGAISTWLMATTNVDQAATAKLWLTGSLNGRGWGEAWPVLACVVVAVAFAGWLAFRLDALALGPDVAQVLGHGIRVAQAVQLLFGVVLVAVAVSAAGPVPFVAFVAPQIAQRLAGTPTPPLLCSALSGALLVSGADLLARTVLPWELPVGIVTAFCGAPALIYLVVKTNRKASA
ncbi:MAG: iron chelate uptake ABC transporter family permease subunit [Kocuria sp.]|uniref:FecCD family ABC transporter permease n=1 Tax=Kocuria TaxID=57493 RepID=UPI001C92EDBE|nr:MULTISPECIES: iron chelate uptake ABC transporter family permease subunit [Kocuria]MDO4255884.1 iron chelate uptake ABC transporter family permease subunit [Kocuria sp.]